MSTWSGIRNKLENDYLCPALRGHIQYFATSYSKSADHEGRAAICMDGVEVLRSNYYIYFENVWTKFHHLRSTNAERLRTPQKRPSTRRMPLRWSRVPLTKRCSMRRLVSLTTRASRKALPARIRLSVSLPFWTAGWESAACLLWRNPWNRSWNWVRAFYVIPECRQKG